MLSLLFTGDFAPFRRYETLVLTKGKEIFGNLQVDISKADLSFLNLETPLCINGIPIKKCGPNIRSHPDCILAVAEAGIDVVGLANNHIMDFGAEGLAETIFSCSNAGLFFCGVGKNIIESQKPLIISKKGIKIGFIAVAEHEFNIAGIDKPGAAPLDPIDNLSQLEQVKELADLVFMIIHGGNEFFPFPRPGLRKMCRFYVEKGANAVICIHSHVPGAIEFHRDKPIFYGLGNLIFDHSDPPKGWREGYAVKLVYSNAKRLLVDYELIPYVQSVNLGGICKLIGAEKEKFLNLIAEYQKTMTEERDYAKAWADFCEGKKLKYTLKLFSPIRFKGLGKINRILPLERLLLPSLNFYEKLDIMRCESHQELLLETLERRYENNSSKWK